LHLLALPLLLLECGSGQVAGVDGWCAAPRQARSPRVRTSS